MKYFEIEFSNCPGEEDGFSEWICIRGNRQPTVKEASEFCKEDAKIIGMPVVRVDPIDEVYARDCYDFSNEVNWPIFA